MTLSDQEWEFVSEVIKGIGISTLFTVANWCSTSTCLTLLLLLVQVNDELCQLMGVQCNVTNTYHPQNNIFDEKFNQTLQCQLLKYVNEDQSTWDLFLDIVLFSYRVARKDSTKVSPSLLLYCRQARLPVELTLKAAIKQEEEEADKSVKGIWRSTQAQ